MKTLKIYSHQYRFLKFKCLINGKCFGKHFGFHITASSTCFTQSGPRNTCRLFSVLFGLHLGVALTIQYYPWALSLSAEPADLNRREAASLPHPSLLGTFKVPRPRKGKAGPARVAAFPSLVVRQTSAASSLRCARCNSSSPPRRSPQNHPRPERAWKSYGASVCEDNPG